MNSGVKIIHISSHYDYVPGYHPPKDGDLYPLASWAGLLAKRMKKRYPQLDIEVWRPDKTVDKISHKEVLGLNTYLFPVRRLMLARALSFQMYRRLRMLCKEHNVVVYCHSIYDSFSIFGPMILPKARFILIHHGGLPPELKGDNLKNKLKHYFISRSYKKVHKLTYQNWINKDFLRSFLAPEKLNFWVVGADFVQFKPLGNKKELRAKYGLNPDTVYGIYVGPYSSLKNVELILEAYKELKDKYDFSVIFIGGGPSDELYGEIHDLGLIDFGKVDWYEMNDFYNCADFYIHPIFNFSREAFGVAPVEAMAANLPVLSTLLPFLQSEFSIDPALLGLPVFNKEEVTQGIEHMILNHRSYLSVRDYSKKILDAEASIIDIFVGLME